ncbi:MAG: (2Fe-2S) ferredoxin domain-containing protein [Clostridia bacterium]|jgi:NADP-reducing hydrogenase subunit HndB|nr:(2Fe-2S) ferredoxin domain-containing protein [Clostridia bacterium]MBR0436213.1 (2Fe-2S) ferredoxin domain-containing protein [Clostridia bacterium]MBR2644724.1 (2Fe-2S) ferredoxin domain-containing protein [Clostridia bacterium]MBR3038773.1 (2Fe-2S) ferredoxin domain-containing protein [Clostridia bacterium]MBR3129380.1 (2Fe-2S) ferredoxin domain-containing protein [Clostridia bacterium]
MKTLEELAQIRDRMKNKVALREGSGEIRVVVGMATCGIAAGARPVLNAFVEQVADQNLGDRVTVTQTGCIGMCRFEPIVEVFEGDKERVTYVKVKPEMVPEIIKEHLIGGKPVTKYTIGAVE